MWATACVAILYKAEAQNRHDIPKAVIACDQMNTLYRGLDNPISVAVPGYMSKEIEVKCLGCKSFQGKNGRYILQPGVDNKIELQIYSLRKRDKSKIIHTQLFRVQKIPDPVLYLFNKRDRDSLNFLPVDNSGISPYWFIPRTEGMDICITSRVSEFTVMFPLGGKWFEKTYPDNRFPQELHHVLTQLPKGTPVYFPSIKVVMPDGSTRDMRFTAYKK